MAHPTTARRAGGYATLFNLLFVSTPYLVGIMALVILPSLGDPELAVFNVAEKLLPPAITGVVMAAIMSTADSLLLQTGSVASRDVYERFINKRAPERQMVWVSRGLVLAIGIVGYTIALLQPPTVFGIVVFTTSVLGSAFLPSYVCAVWWRSANTPGAIASMVSGATIAFMWELLGLAGATGVHPMLAGIVSSTTAMIVVSLATQRVAPVPDHIVATMDAAARLDNRPR